MKGNCCWPISGFTAKLLIPLDPDTLEAADIFEAELVVVIAAEFDAELEEARKKEKWNFKNEIPKRSAVKYKRDEKLSCEKSSKIWLLKSIFYVKTENCTFLKTSHWTISL